MAERVLVTGGSGFVGIHCLVQLIEQGYETRTTVRTVAREGAVRAMLQRAGADPGGLDFAHAELTTDTGWAEAVAGCDYVLHVASPFPSVQPTDPEELIRPARDGALRVLRAARDAGTKRVVLTSSFAAIGYGHRKDKLFDERDWTCVDGPGVTPYAQSKTLAERAAWEFADAEGLPLAVVNPVAVTGPPLGTDLSTSIEIVKRMLEGSMPAIPKLSMGLVDVRDVADLHLRAMTAPEAVGQRFLAISGETTPMIDVARALKAGLGDRAGKVPTRQVPDILVRIGALRDPSLRQVTARLGKDNRASNAKARSVLGWKPRGVEESVVDTARALLDLGIVTA
jgi:nucleoside-diphosphate-sugar epimerase